MAWETRYKLVVTSDVPRISGEYVKTDLKGCFTRNRMNPREFYSWHEDEITDVWTNGEVYLAEMVTFQGDTIIFKNTSLLAEDSPMLFFEGEPKPMESAYDKILLAKTGIVFEQEGLSMPVTIGQPMPALEIGKAEMIPYEVEVEDPPAPGPFLKINGAYVDLSEATIERFGEETPLADNLK